MNFRNISQLSDQLLDWSKRLPRDIDVVVGIPRSGLLAANLFALYRNIALAELDGFLEGRCLSSGSTRRNLLNTASGTSSPYFLERPRKVLVLDDSARSGKTLREARRRIAASLMSFHDVHFAAVYATADTLHDLDFYCELLEPPRVFEWNIFNHHILEESCVDLDGVLCHDPTPEDNDDGPNYLEFISNARPLVTTSYRIGYIVTSRLERYRKETECWLKENAITYKELIMLDYPDGNTSRQLNTHSAHKARFYKKTRAKLFIESDIRQAVEIVSLSKKDVLCTDSMQLISVGSLPIGRPSRILEDHHRRSLPILLLRRLLPPKARATIRRIVSS